MDLPLAVATAAREGNVDAVKAWLAAGGAPDATRQNGTSTLLSHACMELLAAASPKSGRKKDQ